MAYPQSARIVGRFGVSGDASFVGRLGRINRERFLSNHPETGLAEPENGDIRLETGAMAHPNSQRFSRPSISILERGPQQEDTNISGPSRRNVSHADRTRLPDVQRRGAVPDRRGARASDSNGWWDAEPTVGRVVDGVPSRVDRLKCLGNAVVPQVAEWIGGRIMEHQAVCQCGHEEK